MSPRVRASLVLALSLLSSPIVGQEPAAPTARKITSVEGITEYQLDNGLRVLLFPDPSRPKVTVNLTIFVGSRHEGYGETGMAHLLEHMLFKGTVLHPNIPGIMKERGAQFNGSTWVDRTNYYETLTASDDNLEFAIRLEADRMVNSPIRPEDLATEFSVVRNEFEQGENDPRGILSQRMQAVAYEWHNYGKSTIGNRSDIERVPVDNLREFYRKHYQPDNAMVVVAGKFEEAKALELITRYFGILPRPERKLSDTYTEEPAQDGERAVTLRRVGDIGLAGLVYHIPAASHSEFPAVQILALVLTSEPSGRLYKALVESKLATSVAAFPFAFRDPGLIELMAEVRTRDANELAVVRDKMVEVVEGVGSAGITQEEVDRARQQLLRNRELAAGEPTALAIQLSEWAAQGDWRLYFLNRDRLEQVTPQQVQEVATKYLVSSNRTVGLFVPTAAPERTPIPATPDIAALVKDYRGRAAEAAGELIEASPQALEARIERTEKIAGVQLALLPKKTRGELVNLSLRLDFGHGENLRGLVEASSLLGELMTRGTTNLTRQQIEDELDRNFARLTASSSTGTLTFAVQTKRANLPAVLDILRQILREPSFPENEFATHKSQALAGLEESQSEPQAIAGRLVSRLTTQYPPDDVRYAPTIEEQIERLKGVTLEQVRGLHRDYLGADHGELALVGDFSPQEVVPLLAPLFADWHARQPYARIEQPFQPDIPAARQSVLTPDKANAVYLAMLTLPMSDAHPDYPALVMGNYVLGGGSLSSRIADRLRQKEGLSYGAGSFFMASALDERARLAVQAIYNPANVQQVVQATDEEIELLLRDGVTADELEKAKVGFLSQRQVRWTNDRNLTDILVTQLFNGRTMEYEAELERRIRELTPDVVNAAMRKHIEPARLVVVTAGDFQPAATN